MTTKAERNVVESYSEEVGMVVPTETATRFQKGVKQVATLGPKTFSKDMIEKLFLAGVDVFRLNLSHGAEDKVQFSLQLYSFCSQLLCLHLITLHTTSCYLQISYTSPQFVILVAAHF